MALEWVQINYGVIFNLSKLQTISDVKLHTINCSLHKQKKSCQFTNLFWVQQKVLSVLQIYFLTRYEKKHTLKFGSNCHYSPFELMTFNIFNICPSYTNPWPKILTYHRLATSKLSSTHFWACMKAKIECLHSFSLLFCPSFTWIRVILLALE